MVHLVDLVHLVCLVENAKIGDLIHKQRVRNPLEFCGSGMPAGALASRVALLALCINWNVEFGVRSAELLITGH